MLNAAEEAGFALAVVASKSGPGAAIARGFAARGAAVAVVGTFADPPDIDHVGSDLSSRAGAEDALATAVAQLGHIDALVYAATVTEALRMRGLTELQTQDWRATCDAIVR